MIIFAAIKKSSEMPRYCIFARSVYLLWKRKATIRARARETIAMHYPLINSNVDSIIQMVHNLRSGWIQDCISTSINFPAMIIQRELLL